MLRPNQIIYSNGNPYPYSVEKIGSGGPQDVMRFSSRRPVFITQETPEDVQVGSIIRHMGQRFEVTEHGLIQLGYFMPAADPRTFTPTEGQGNR